MGRKREKKKKTRELKSPAPPPKRKSKRKRVVPLFAIFVLGFVAWGLSGLRHRFAPLEREALNVIVVTADTLRPDRLGCYGNTRVATPNLDGLAESGVLFEHTTTVTPLTLPSHASIFTGTFPMYHGVRDNGGYYLEQDQLTLAEILKEKGYSTAAFVAAFVLDSRWGLDQGFDHYFDEFDFSEVDDISLDSVQRRGDEVMGEAIDWLESVKKDRFFSWIHLYDPHTPFDPPEPYRSQYQGVQWGLYDGEVAFLDSLMGQLLDWLDANQLTENTIVAFLGDHGESLGQHQEITHGFFVYDATVAVPFILKTPHRRLEGRRVSAQVRTIDLMPTLLDLLGFDIPERIQGRSLVELGSGRTDDLGLIAYSESLYPRHHYGWSDLKSLRNGTLHYIASPSPELYDISKDPQEKTNLATERPEDIKAFERELQEILELYSVEGIDEKGPEALDPETQAQLAALGYLGGATKVDIDPTAPLADPKDKIGLFNLIKQAGSDSSEGRIEDAFTKIRKVLDEDPEILEAHLILGNLHNKRDEKEKAIEAYKEALARDPEYLSALHSMAATYLTMGKREEAEAGFQRLLDLDPRNSRALFMLAEIQSRKKDYREAVELLNRALETGGERAPTYNLMAECLIELERLDEAEAAVRQAIDLQEDLRTAHFNLALIQEAKGDPEGAIRAYEREIEISPKDHKSHFNLAKLYAGAGNLQKTIEHFRRSIEIDSSFAEGHLYLAKLYLDQGDLEQAMDLAQKANELDPDPSLAPMGHFILADVYNRMGRLQDAEREVAIARSLQK